MYGGPITDGLERRERELERTSSDDLEALSLVDAASRSLAELIGLNPVQPVEGSSTPLQLNYKALWFMSVSAFRAARAAMSVLRVGYEDQAVVYVRLIDELFHRADRVRRDPSGQYARDWLKGHSPGKPAKLAGQEFWELFSGPAHANSRAVFDWLAIPDADGSTKVMLGPERRPEQTNHTLVFIAGELRDIAAMLAVAADLPIDALASLTSAIEHAQSKHQDDDSSAA